MSVVPIAIGRCGMAINSILNQYSVDYINNLNSRFGSGPESPDLEINTFIDSIKRLYFKDSDLLDGTTLTSRSINIATQLQRFEHLSDNKSCEGLFVNADEGDKPREPKGDKIKLSWKTNPNTVIDLPDPTYGICSTNYYGTRQEKDDIEASIMKEIENTDSLNGILSLAGLGGGTGSGLTSLVSTIISDNLGKTKHLIAGVLPFSYGESPTQSINTILDISSTYDKCDGLILIPNDEHETYFKLSMEKWTADLNTIDKAYGMNLFHALRPLASTCEISNRPRYTKSFDYLIDGLCSFPSLKLLDIKLLTKNSKVISSDHKIHEQMLYQLVDIINNDNRSALSTKEKITFSSKDLGKEKTSSNTAENFTFHDFERYKNKVEVSNSDALNQIKNIPISAPKLKDTIIKPVGFLTSGTKLSEEISRTKNKKGIRMIRTFDTKRKAVTRNNVVVACQINIGGPITENLNISDICQNVMFWKSSARPIQVSYSKYDEGINGKLVSGIMNSQSQIEKVDNILVSGVLQFQKNAYLHKYAEYGIEKSEIRESIIKVENIKENYRNIS